MRQLVQFCRWRQQRGGRSGGMWAKRSGMRAMCAHCPLPHLGGRR